MKKDLDQKEKAERLAKRMARAEFHVFLAACVVGILSFCKKLQLVFGVNFNALFVAGCLLLLLIAAVINVFHTNIFPNDVAEYPVYDAIYNFESLVTAEFGEGAKVFTKGRMIGGAIVICTTLLFTVLMNIFRPVKTAPKNIPSTLFYNADGSRILAGDFGEIARWDEKDECWSICTSVEAYGPFQYGGEVEELQVTHLVIDSITLLGETVQSLGAPDREEIIMIKFNHYEDGDWMIVKRFVEGGTVVATDYDAGFAVMLDRVSAGEIAYKKHDLTGAARKKIRTLTAATNDVLEWEKVGKELVWSVKE